MDADRYPRFPVPPGPYKSADAPPGPGVTAPLVGGAKVFGVGDGPGGSWDYRNTIRGGAAPTTYGSGPTGNSSYEPRGYVPQGVGGTPGQQTVVDYGPAFDSGWGGGTKVTSTADRTGRFNSFSDAPPRPAQFEGTGLSVGPGGYPINPPAVGNAATAIEGAAAGRAKNAAIAANAAPGGYPTFGGAGGPAGGPAGTVGGGGGWGGYAPVMPRAGSAADPYGVGADIAAARQRYNYAQSRSGGSILDAIHATRELKNINAMQERGIQAGQLGVAQGHLGVARDQQGVNWGNLAINQAQIGVNQRQVGVHERQQAVEQWKAKNDPTWLQNTRAYQQIGEGNIDAARAGQITYHTGKPDIVQIEGPTGKWAGSPGFVPPSGVWAGYPGMGIVPAGPLTAAPTPAGVQAVQIGPATVPMPNMPQINPLWRSQFHSE